MKHTFNIPARMAHLPIDERGYPIPYFVPIVNGKPNFLYSDPKKKAICRKYKKCWVCGTPLLAEQFWVITGPIGLHNRTVSDEPAHEECARFSLIACPHMYYEKADRRTDLFEGLPSQSPFKPTKLILVHADKVTYYDEVHTQFRPKRFEVYEYIDNHLTKVPTPSTV